MDKNLQYKFFSRTLLKRRVELHGLINAANENARPVELDQSKVGRLSRMDAMQSQAMARETQRRRKIDLQKVEVAIKRLKDDEYGFCCICDNPIPEKRLEFDPATTTCVACASTAK